MFLIPSLIASLFLTSCKDEQTTTVSKSPWGGGTIVSRSDSSGSYTRTKYGSDVFGNKTISVSRGHENATEQGDLIETILKGLASAIANSETDRQPDAVIEASILIATSGASISLPAPEP